jgi:hypothetical protein
MVETLATTNPTSTRATLSNPNATWLLHVGHGAVRLSLLVIVFGGVGPIRLTQLFILLGVSIVKGHLLGLGILVDDGQHLHERPGIFHGELAN